MLSSGLIRPKLKEMGCHIREDCRKTNEKEILAQTREELISPAGKTAGLFGLSRLHSSLRNYLQL